MSCGRRCVGAGGGAGGLNLKPTPPRVCHPRYVPRRGAVLKRAVCGALRFFLFIPVNGLVAVSAVVGGRVRPAPPPGPAGGGAAEQGK